MEQSRLSLICWCNRVMPVFSLISWRTHILNSFQHSYFCWLFIRWQNKQLTWDTYDKASTLHIVKGKLPFSCFFVLMLKVNVCVCVGCNAETFYLSWLKRGRKKKEASKCVIKGYMLLLSCLISPWFTSLWALSAICNQVISELFYRGTVRYFVRHWRIWKDADKQGCAVGLLLSWVASSLISLCVVWLMHEL